MTTKTPAETLSEIAASLKLREREFVGAPTEPEPSLLRCPKRPVTRGFLENVLKQFVELLGADLGAIDRRLDALEARPTLKYVGVHQRGTTYQPGECVTSAGSLWIASRVTTGQPGDPDSGFTLAVKRGRDGRDAS
jgi:hypothetical protein